MGLLSLNPAWSTVVPEQPELNRKTYEKNKIGEMKLQAGPKIRLREAALSLGLTSPSD